MSPPNSAKPESMAGPKPAGERHQAPGRAAPGAPSPAFDARQARLPERSGRIEIRDLLGNFSDQTGASFQ